MIEIPRKEVYRYLGYRNQIPDERIQEEVEKSIQQFRSCRPKHVLQEFDVYVNQDEVRFESLCIHSKNLSKNLQDCQKVVCMATTLGLEADRLIKRAGVSQKSEMVIFQAVGAAMIEAYTDQINDQINEEVLKKGYYCRPRYSCGYGDFDLSYQKEFIRILNMPKTIGVTLTTGDLMVPSKSITALIGLSRIKENDEIESCLRCSKKDCAYKK